MKEKCVIVSEVLYKARNFSEINLFTYILENHTKKLNASQNFKQIQKTYSLAVFLQLQSSTSGWIY